MTIYEQRQEQQRLRQQYREHAQKLVEVLNDVPIFQFRLDDHANVQIMDDGAFVELIVWVPKVQLDKS